VNVSYKDMKFTREGVWIQGFFRRALQDIGDPSRKKCYYNKNCDITILTRNRCQYCRLKKCLALGMSRSGTAFDEKHQSNRVSFDMDRQ